MNHDNVTALQSQALSYEVLESALASLQQVLLLADGPAEHGEINAALHLVISKLTSKRLQPDFRDGAESVVHSIKSAMADPNYSGWCDHVLDAKFELANTVALRD